MSGHEHFTESTGDFGAGLSEQGRINTTALRVHFVLFPPTPETEFSVVLINRLPLARDLGVGSVQIVNCCAGADFVNTRNAESTKSVVASKPKAKFLSLKLI